MAPREEEEEAIANGEDGVDARYPLDR
jgi:hypothetical protein